MLTHSVFRVEHILVFTWQLGITSICIVCVPLPCFQGNIETTFHDEKLCRGYSLLMQHILKLVVGGTQWRAPPEILW